MQMVSSPSFSSTIRYSGDLTALIVLTKVIVYAGIGLLAAHVTPVMFEILGWGV